MEEVTKIRVLKEILHISAMLNKVEYLLRFTFSIAV